MLRFPGLSEKDHESITATSVGIFVGGDDTSKKLLTQEEYDRIEKIFKEQLTQDATEAILSNFDQRAEFIPIPIPEAMTTLDITLNKNVKV